MTVTGQACLKWTDDSLYYKDYNINSGDFDFPDKGLGDHNYCRNPDLYTSAYCFYGYGYMDAAKCDVPQCPATGNTNTL